MRDGPNDEYLREQALHRGTSSKEIHEAALSAAAPEPGLSWLDIGCGTGELLCMIADRWAPTRLTGVDLIDQLTPSARRVARLVVGPAEEELLSLEQADRVLFVESLESLEAPWTALRVAAQRVAAGGRLVVTVPNVESLRNRLGLLLRGQLASFRPSSPAQRTPILAHVIEATLRYEGLIVDVVAHAMPDVIPLTSGRTWPRAINATMPKLTSVSIVVAASAAS